MSDQATETTETTETKTEETNATAQGKTMEQIASGEKTFEEAKKELKLDSFQNFYEVAKNLVDVKNELETIRAEQAKNKVSLDPAKAAESTEKSFSDVAKEYKLSKFKNVENLAKSYSELQKTMSSKPTLKDDAKDEDIVNYSKQVFSKILDKESALENEALKNTANQLRELGIPARVGDFAATKLSTAIAEDIANRRKQSAEEFLGTEGTQEKVETFLKTQNNEYSQQLNDRLAKGNVSVDELKLLANLGTPISEGESSAGSEEKKSVSNEAELLKEYNSMLDDKDIARALHRPSHPDYKKLNDRFKEIEKALGLS